MLYNLKYVITSALGETPFYNQHKLIAAVFGIGQAAADEPAGWLFISNITLKCYSRSATGCNITDPCNKLTVPSDADMFVNDNTLMHNAPEIDIPTTTLMAQIQKDAELWG
eukprot:7256805-Ditylum_brightwellii.AAC.1